mmetsp:Transcript_60548/g.166289  ORF Transcript_60548/g.166289 Transcript_60548/m.166289 type:complete len:214 (+) Transcript_60548:313-954(+)
MSVRGHRNVGADFAVKPHEVAGGLTLPLLRALALPLSCRCVAALVIQLRDKLQKRGAISRGEQRIIELLRLADKLGQEPLVHRNPPRASSGVGDGVHTVYAVGSRRQPRQAVSRAPLLQLTEPGRRLVQIESVLAGAVHALAEQRSLDCDATEILVPNRLHRQRVRDPFEGLGDTRRGRLCGRTGDLECQLDLKWGRGAVSTKHPQCLASLVR